MLRSIKQRRYELFRDYIYIWRCLHRNAEIPLRERKFYGGVIKVEPGAETDLAAIINNVDVLEGGSPSFFTEVIDGWTMNLEVSQEEKEYMNSFTIEELRTFFWGIALMSEGYSREEAEAIVGVSGEPQMPYIVDEPSDPLQGGITLDDVSYTLFGMDNRIPVMKRRSFFIGYGLNRYL